MSSSLLMPNLVFSSGLVDSETSGQYRQWMLQHRSSVIREIKRSGGYHELRRSNNRKDQNLS